MATRTLQTMWLAAALVSLVTGAACTTNKSEAPAIAGPSELGLSLQVTASPDVLTMDGASQSVVAILARNANGQPQGGVGLRIETRVGATLVDIGRLSTKFVTTGGDGRASVSFTAPLSPPEGNSDSGAEVVTVRVIPVSSDYSNAVERSVDIRLLPRGVILPPAGVPVASFVFSPAAPVEDDVVTFDASASRDCPVDSVDAADCQKRGTTTGLTYEWNFGDGTTGTGVQVTHRFTSPGSFAVTLAVTNGRGNSATATKFVEVKLSADPTSALFVFSPSQPVVNQSVFFDAALAKAAPGRSIIAYDWSFGDGGFGSGVTVSHRYSREGEFNVTLTVTDDLGKTLSSTKAVSVSATGTGGGGGAPTASFVSTPLTITPVNVPVTFDASGSTAQAGKFIQSYLWTLGDGNTRTCPGGTGCDGARLNYLYVTAGNFTVGLVVTDSGGLTSAQVTRQLTVQP